jgi:hypothetical protein
MKRFIGALGLAAFAVPLSAGLISTQKIDPAAATAISLSPEVETVLVFPSPVYGFFGQGIVERGKAGAEPACIEMQHPGGSPILTLHALTPDAKATLVVLMEGKPYTFTLQTRPDPDVSVTLVKAGSETGPAGGEPPRAVSAREVKAERPRYSDEGLRGLWLRAKHSVLYKKLPDDLYKGYSSRLASYESDTGAVKVTVTKVHRFSPEDAVVIEANVKNETDHPLDFDGRAVTVVAQNEEYPATWVYCPHPIPAGQTVPMGAIVQGGLDGVSRNNLSIENAYRLYLPPLDGDQPSQWGYSNGRMSGGAFAVSKPTPEPLIPREPTGTPTQENR